MADEDRAPKGLTPADEFFDSLRNSTDFAYHAHWLEPEVQPHLTTRGQKGALLNLTRSKVIE